MSKKIDTLPQNRAFYLYLLKLTNIITNQVQFKLGKSDDYIKRKKDWENELIKIYSSYDEYITVGEYRIELVWHKECWYTSDDGKFKYYMTTNEKLCGNDSDDIFRKILGEYFCVNTYDIYVNETFFSDEGVDFGKSDLLSIRNILESAYLKWIEIIKEKSGVSSCDYFVRLSLDDGKRKKKEKEEFTDIAHQYQKDTIEWIYAKLSIGFNKDFIIIIPCGGGKTSISTSACVKLSMDKGYKPTLVLAGLKSVFGAFKDDTGKFTYYGKDVECYDIKEFTKEIYDNNIKNKIPTIVYTTCQSGMKRGSDDDIGYDEKLSERLKFVLDEDIRFSSVVTDEAHKTVFGEKMMNLYPLLRKYHKDGLNIIHMSGTGFNLMKKIEIKEDDLYEIDESVIREAQGDAAVNRHIIVCRNNGFIPYFKENVELGLDYILDGKISVDMFKDVDNINCISTIKSGIEKPVVCMYLPSIEIVRKCAEYLSKKYSYEDVLVISANGCFGYGEKDFTRNGMNDMIVKIKNPYNEVKSEITRAVNNKKMVILLNVDKFVESWTIKEMNVALVLSDVGSPDRIGQLIPRGSRTFVERSNVVKKDSYVFLYGDTFTKMTYGLFFDRYNYLKGCGGDKEKSAYSKAMGGVFWEYDKIYIDDVVYGYEENNLNYLRDLILYDAPRRYSAESMISSIKRTFPDSFEKLLGIKVDIENTVKTKNSTIKTNVVDGEGNHRDRICDKDGECGDSSGKRDVSEKELFEKIKTFMYSLLLARIQNHTGQTLESGLFDWDILVLEADENPVNGRNNYYMEFEKQLSELFGEEIEHFKKTIMNWIEGQCE
jgi:hypothetical protein